MDISYAVQQLDREIAFGEQNLSDKKNQRDALYKALGKQDQALVDDAKGKIKTVHAPPQGKG